MQTFSGLTVPVLQQAESQDTWGCAREILRLADVPRAGKAARQELLGSTVTITSLGPVGCIVSAPVISHPEPSTSTPWWRPVIRGGVAVARQLMNLSSSSTNAWLAAMDAARFVQAIRALLEKPTRVFKG